MKKFIYTILVMGIILGGCIDKDRTNPYDTDYDGPTGSIVGMVLLEGGRAQDFVGPTGNKVVLNHSGITIAILELPRLVASTDVFGNYSFTGVPPGTWTLVASKFGYNAQSIYNVTVSSGSAAQPSTLTLTEAIWGRLLFSSQNTATGWNELLVMDADGSNRKQLTFQDVNMTGGDPLAGSKWIIFDIEYIDGDYSTFNAGFFLYDRATGAFSPLMLVEEAAIPGVQEGTTSDLNWGPQNNTPIIRTLTIENGTANGALGFATGTTVTETANRTLIFEYESFLTDETYIGAVEVVVPADGSPPHLPGMVPSNAFEDYTIYNNTTLIVTLDGAVTRTITFNIDDPALPPSGNPDLGIVGASVFTSDPDQNNWYAEASSVELAGYINWWFESNSGGFGADIGAAGNGLGNLLLRPKAPIIEVTPKGEGIDEFSPDVSQDDILAYVARAETAQGYHFYQIETMDLSTFGNPPMTFYLNRADPLNPELPDFDDDLMGDLQFGATTTITTIVPDSVKLLAIWASYLDSNFCAAGTEMWVTNFASVDWSEVVLDGNTLLLLYPPAPIDCATFGPFGPTWPVLQGGSEPDGVNMSPEMLLIELGDLTEVWDPAWSPEKIGSEVLLSFADMKNSSPGAMITYFDVAPTTVSTEFFTGVCYDINGTPGCQNSANFPTDFDLPVDPEDNFSVSPSWIDPVERIEYFALNGLVLDSASSYNVTDTFTIVEPEENAYVAQPAFSPGGDRMVYVGGVRSKATGEMLRGDLYSFDMDAGFIKRLTTDAMYNRGPIWLEY